MTGKRANSSAAGWSLITSGVTEARVEAHRLQKLITMAQRLVDGSDHKDHIYQVAGDLIMGMPRRLERLINDLDRTSYALAKIGEDHLRDRLPIADRATVDDGVENPKPFGGQKPRTAAGRVAGRWIARNGR
jgi:hypothetical protein